uniref:Uncharacterized protein n=1 Tax=Trichogramma kaykai TaxID=54128 RepID=A0ABD2WI83_9HYME
MVNNVLESASQLGLESYEPFIEALRRFFVPQTLERHLHALLVYYVYGEEARLAAKSGQVSFFAAAEAWLNDASTRLREYIVTEGLGALVVDSFLYNPRISRVADELERWGYPMPEFNMSTLDRIDLLDYFVENFNLLATSAYDLLSNLTNFEIVYKDVSLSSLDGSPRPDSPVAGYFPDTIERQRGGAPYTPSEAACGVTRAGCCSSAFGRASSSSRKSSPDDSAPSSHRKKYTM